MKKPDLLPLSVMRRYVVYMGTREPDAINFPDGCMIATLAPRGKYGLATRYVDEPYKPSGLEYKAKRLVTGKFARPAKIWLMSISEFSALAKKARQYLPTVAAAFCENTLSVDTSMLDGFAFPLLGAYTLVLRDPHMFLQRRSVYDLLERKPGARIV